MRPGGMPHYEDRVGIAAVLAGVVVGPAGRLGHIMPAICLIVASGQQTVVGGDEDEALVHERLRLLLDAFLVARLPAAAMNPHDDRMVFPLGRGKDIERLALVFGVGVGQTAMDFRLLGEQWGREEEEQDGSRDAHGCLSDPVALGL